MAQGNLKASKWAIVINGKKKTPSDALKQQLREFLASITNFSTATNYFAIVHDKDTTELGEPKRTHLHLVLEYDRKTTFSAVMSELTQVVGLDSEQISLEPANSEILAEQYLIHKNDPSKYQYSAEDIETNNKKVLVDRLTARYLTPEEKEAERLEALKTSRTFNELIERAGLEYAHKYRPSFNELRQEREQDIESVLKRLDTLDKRYRNLIREIRQIAVEIDMSHLDINKTKEVLELLADNWGLD